MHIGDFRIVSDRIPDGSVDLAICDGPWAEWATLAVPMGQILRRVLKPNGFACVYMGVTVEDQWNDALKQNLVKEWRLMSLHRNPGKLLYNGVRHMYTSIVLYRNNPSGPLTTKGPLPDVIESPKAQKQHDLWEQPVIDSEVLIRGLTKPGELICDLTLGTGTVAVATALVGEGRRFVGCEIDPAKVAQALTRVAEVLK